MLIQVPRRSSDQQGSDGAEAREAFEVALRRDLASAPVVSYEMVLGGWTKRAADIVTVVLASPLWLPLMLAAALVAKLRYGQAFCADERIGYGGQFFRRFKLRMTSPKAAQAPADGDDSEQAKAWRAMAAEAKDRGAKWRYAFERLPQMFNVLRGDMSIIGPAPLSIEELEALKAAKRHYFTARPGVIGVAGMLDPGDEPALQYKAYAMSWSFMTDALIMWEAATALPKRGELWRPGLARVKPTPQPEVLHRRKRA